MTSEDTGRHTGALRRPRWALDPFGFLPAGVGLTVAVVSGWLLVLAVVAGWPTPQRALLVLLAWVVAPGYAVITSLRIDLPRESALGLTLLLATSVGIHILLAQLLQSVGALTPMIHAAGVSGLISAATLYWWLRGPARGRTNGA